MVIMDREDYGDRANSLLTQAAYRSISRDPTNNLKAKLITILRGINRASGLEDTIYKCMHPIGCISPKFYGLPIIHKTNMPLKPIVSSRGSVTYGVAKVLAKILKPLAGKSPHHIQSTKDCGEGKQGKYPARTVPLLLLYFFLMGGQWHFWGDRGQISSGEGKRKG